MRRSRLRDYQADVLDRVLSALDVSGNVVLQMPTGAGKTVTAVELAHQKMSDGPVWFVCHRREIRRQAARAFKRAGVSFGIIAPGETPYPNRAVQIASIDTLRLRPKDFEKPGTIIWDECHHIAANTWAALKATFPDAWHVGLTATPERLDGKGLAKHFDQLVRGPSIRELIKEGYLAKYRIFAPSEPDLTSARIRAGDYRKEDLEQIMNTPVLIGDAVEHYEKIAPGSRALAFTVSVEASRALVKQFVKAGVPALHIDGDTSEDVRDRAVADLGAGRIRVLSNVNVFTEGVDVPELDTIILLRPTRSLALYLQMIGRGLRPSKGKKHATILDHAGLVYEHGFPDAEWDWSLEGGARKRRVAAAQEAEERLRECPVCTCVHEPAPVCAACGFEYPTGKREVDQYDGVLREIVSLPLPGEVTKAQFARINSVHSGSVMYWIRKGLPLTSSGYISLEEGRLWLEKSRFNLRSVAGHISQSEFGRRMGVPDHAVNTWVRNGMPSDKRSKRVIEDAAVEWLKNWTEHFPEVENAKRFAERVGQKHSRIHQWIKKGLPVNAGGFVRVAPALKWISENVDLAKYELPRGETMAPVSWASKHCINPNKVAKWVARGVVPLTSSGRVDVIKADKWLLDNGPDKLPSEPIVHEWTGSFAKRIGVDQHRVKRWLKDGLPHIRPNKKALIFINKGLHWVRDNTNVKIPKSAWKGVKPNSEKVAA
jgi:DNA repair protein RadD